MNNAYHRIWQRVIETYAKENSLKIAHTQAVVDYTEWIAVNEKLPERQVFLLKTAALLHDIGCPDARKLYGKSLPPYQEKEGRRIVLEWLPDYADFSKDEINYIAGIVGAHHQLEQAEKLHFETLFEADLIVNILEGYYKREKAAFYRDKMIKTVSGKKLFAIIFPETN